MPSLLVRLKGAWKAALVLAALAVFYAHALVGDLRLTATRGQDESADASPRQIMGIDALEKRLGDRAPTGRGIVFGHVEGGAGDYAPRHGADSFRGVQFTLESGASKVNGHADATSRQIYGPSGLAPGVERVRCFTTTDWMGPLFLRTGQPDGPAESDCRVFTHSWIGNSTAGAAHVLRRIDWVADERDVVIVVGLNNGKDSKVPPLLGSAYNAIAVGVDSGNSSGGYTQIEGEGRCKPDLVAPHKLTSFSTPMVAAIAGRLLETADHHPQADAARHAEVIKAVLLSGAAKPTGWKPAEGKPLDEHLGAGVVRADHSYGILSAEQQPPGEVKPFGWDFHPLDKDSFATYRLTIDEAVGPVSITLVWHRRVLGRTVEDPDSGESLWHNGARIADFDLRLARSAGEDEAGILARSTGEIDNVEHIWIDRLTPGQYVFQVSRKDANDELWDYALAWRFGDWE